MNALTHTAASILAVAISSSLSAAQPPHQDNSQQQGPQQPVAPSQITEFRTIDGSSNNVQHPAWGTTASTQYRFFPVAYGDGSNTPSGADRPSPRAISNAVCSQVTSMPNRLNVSDMLWQWGQFLDHDLTLTFTQSPPESFNIAVPAGDPYFDPNNTGTQVIPLSRSIFSTVDGVRQQVNSITSYIDASQVYGSDTETAQLLRRLDGTGKMKTSDGALLPLADDGFFFVAGDIRVNEQIGLMAIQTLFLREHNYWADAIRERALPTPGAQPPAPIPGLPAITGEVTDEKIYQLARVIVAAEIQAISYREFLPALLGHGAIAPYRGYRPDIDATVANEFAVAAYRFGHSMLSPELLRLGANNQPIAEGNLSLANSFFAPQEVRTTGIDPILRGLSRQKAQDLDPYIVDGVRNFLFGAPGQGGFDLASLNIQRGRDHGLPSYNQIRGLLGRPPAQNFRDITRNTTTANRLASVYASPAQVDPWVGMLAEDDVPGALVGPTLFAILTEQFEATRDGDRFWYQKYLPAQTQRLVEQQTLATIIRRNTAIRGELQNDVFHVSPTQPQHPHHPVHPVMGSELVLLD